MADIFCLKCKDGDDGWTYLDIPYSHCAEDVELSVYGTPSSGKNQCWMLVEDRILSAINPKFCIAVSEVKEGILFYTLFIYEFLFCKSRDLRN